MMKHEYRLVKCENGFEVIEFVSGISTGVACKATDGLYGFKFSKYLTLLTSDTSRDMAEMLDRLNKPTNNMIKGYQKRLDKTG